MDDSHIEFSSTSGTVSFVGADATKLYQAKVVVQGLKACKKGSRLNRAYTPTALLRTAGNITGKVYKRGAYDQAVSDLQTWIEAMECALPKVVN